jgi:hypothetical protein
MQQGENDIVTLDIDDGGRIFAKCQVTDYKLRGEQLERYNMLDYFTHTYEVATKSPEQLKPKVNGQAKKGRGRPSNMHVPYLPQHPKASRNHRVVRTPGHNTLPNVIGRWFVRRDDAEVRPLYCASMLMLFKPWRDIKVDLKTFGQSWEDAFQLFLNAADPSQIRAMSGIQYFHECKSSTDRESNEGDQDDHCQEGGSGNAMTASNHQDDNQLEEDCLEDRNECTEESLAILIASQTSFREHLHGRMAVEAAKRERIFSSSETEWQVVDGQSGIRNANGEDMAQLMEWKAQMKDDVDRSNNADLPVRGAPAGGHEVGPSVQMDTVPNLWTSEAMAVDGLTPEERLTPVTPADLMPDQFRAYEIICWHLDATLAGA